MDTHNPLYSETVEGDALRAGVVKDYLIPTFVDPADKRMRWKGGLRVKNLSGKPVVFRKNKMGMTAAMLFTLRKNGSK